MHNLHLASYEHIKGKPISSEASRFFGDCKTYIDLMQIFLEIHQGEVKIGSKGLNEKLMLSYGMLPEHISKFPDELGREITTYLLRAIVEKNGQFFNDLARLCEAPERKDISLREWLLFKNSCFWREIPEGQDPERYFTGAELKKAALKRGVVTKEISERYIRQLHDELGCKLLRPKKKSF